MPFYNGISMNTTVTIDKAGRIVIPKALRDEMRLSPGDALELESAGESVMLRPAHTGGRLIKKHGIWVYRGEGAPMDAQAVNKLRHGIYEERERRLRGKDE